MDSGSIWRQSSRAIASGSVMPNPPVLWDIESDPVAGRHEADRRSLGCGRAVPGGQLHRG